ncbi:MAG: hypothetical protein R3F44_09945 [Candidatus Competibacteraceae bacterium]
MAVGVPNPWMAVGQASLVLAILFIIDSGISAWRRWRRRTFAGALASALLVIVSIGTGAGRLGVLHVRMPILVTPSFLLLAWSSAPS